MTPEDLLYSKDHEWLRLVGDEVVIGITDFAAGELGDIVYVDVDKIGETLEANAVFGSIEAVKTVSDLFLPAGGTVLAVNHLLADEPELVNSDPYGEGWLIKVKLTDLNDLDLLLNAAAYKELTGHV